MDAGDTIKVRFKLDPASWHGSESEGIWAKLVKALSDKAIVEVDNIPFFTKSVSFGDKITVILAERQVIFDSVVERGGHSTYRIFLATPTKDQAEVLEQIRAMGCDWEKTKFNGGELYALDIPPAVDIYRVYAILDKGQRDGAWLFEEGYIGHPLKGDPAPNIL